MVDSSAKKVKLHKYCSMKFCINNDSYGGHSPVSFIYKLKKTKTEGFEIEKLWETKIKDFNANRAQQIIQDGDTQMQETCKQNVTFSHERKQIK